MKAEDYQRRRESHAGWTMNIVSYRLGDRFYCTVDNADPGARLSRGEGATATRLKDRRSRKRGACWSRLAPIPYRNL